MLDLTLHNFDNYKIKMFDGEVEMAYCSPDGEIAKSLHEKG